MKLLLVGIAAVIAVTACGSDDGGGDDADGSGATTDQTEVLTELDGTRLIVDTIDGEPVLADTTLTMSVAADGTLQGTTGCNPFTGQISTEGDSVSVGQLAVGASLCPSDAAQAQERAFTEAVTQTTSLSVDGDTVRFVDDEGTPRVEATQRAGGLVGSWDVLAYNNGRDAVVSLISGTALTASFDEDGTVSGSAGCNDYSAAYSLDDDTITIDPAEVTEQGCEDPPGVMDQEQEYLDALVSAAVWSITGDELTLRNGDDQIAVTMRLIP